MQRKRVLHFLERHARCEDAPVAAFFETRMRAQGGAGREFASSVGLEQVLGLFLEVTEIRLRGKNARSGVGQVGAPRWHLQPS